MNSSSIQLWTFLALPLLMAASVVMFKWAQAVSAADNIGGWLDAHYNKSAGKTGWFTNFVIAPSLWCFTKLFELTKPIEAPFLRAGVRLASWLYIGVALLFVLYWATAIAIAIAIVVAIIAIIKLFTESNDRSPRASPPSDSYVGGSGESRHREDFGGPYTETRDTEGNIVSESRERNGFLGAYTDTRDTSGNVVVESRQREGLVGAYTEHRNAAGDVVGESRQRDGFLGPYTETRDAEGNVVRESRERDGFSGPYTEHKKSE